MCYEWFDKNKIMQDVDAYQVALNIGMETKKKGSYIFIRCPGHAKRIGHEDAHMNNAYLTRRGYHCCVCDKTVDAVTMVMEYLGCSYADALSKIADINGNREAYYDEEKMNSRKNYKKGLKKVAQHPPMISYEEQQLIGLTPEYGKTKIPISYKDYAEDGYQKYDIRGRIGYLKYSSNLEDRINISSLYKDDYDSYRYLIVSKCFEAIDKYEKTISLLPEYGKIFPELATTDMQIGIKYVLCQYCKKIWQIVDHLFPAKENQKTA